jgi:hypothetical protein
LLVLLVLHSYVFCVRSRILQHRSTNPGVAPRVVLLAR